MNKMMGGGERDRPADRPRPATPPLALDDAQQALRMVRSRAAEWSVDPKRVGMIGFSAGAMTTLATALRNDAGCARGFHWDHLRSLGRQWGSATGTAAVCRDRRGRSAHRYGRLRFDQIMARCKGAGGVSSLRARRSWLRHAPTIDDQRSLGRPVPRLDQDAGIARRCKVAACYAGEA